MSLAAVSPSTTLLSHPALLSHTTPAAVYAFLFSGGLDNPELGPRFLHHVLYKRLRIQVPACKCSLLRRAVCYCYNKATHVLLVLQGILARDFTPRHGEMVAAVSAWIAEGALKFRETVVEGFDKLPDALASLFKGANTGKLVVKVADVESS